MIALTFDTDHMSESAMEAFLAEVPVPGAGTFFCIQRYACMEGSGHELAPHPLLESGGDWEAELERTRELFPEARGWRSHSCIFSHLLALRVKELGYDYVSVHDDFGRAGQTAIRHAWGVWQFPIYYMDTLDMSMSRFWPEAWSPFSPELIKRAVEDDGIYVFDFHPVHLMLNSPTAEDYLERRKRIGDDRPFAEIAFDGYGARNFYDALCAAMEAKGLESVALAEAHAQLVDVASPEFA